MSKLRIDPAPTGIPELPVGKLMSLPLVPQTALDPITQESPIYGGTVPAAVADNVTIYVFMPKLPSGACPHCAKSIQSLVNLRSRVGGLPLRIVAITNGEGADLPVRADLQLDNDDLLCSDPDLKSFEAFGLIDSVPELAAGGGFEFPLAFYPGSRRLREESDLMHGLFVVDSDGNMYSERRGFEAFDETDQIIEEAKIALLPKAQRNSMLDSILESVESSQSKNALQRSVEYLRELESTQNK